MFLSILRRNVSDLCLELEPKIPTVYYGSLMLLRAFFRFLKSRVYKIKIQCEQRYQARLGLRI